MPLNNKPNAAVSANNVAGIPYVTEAPGADFKGMACILYTDAAPSTLTLYLRHPKSGNWIAK